MKLANSLRRLTLIKPSSRGSSQPSTARSPAGPLDAWMSESLWSPSRAEDSDNSAETREGAIGRALKLNRAVGRLNAIIHWTGVRGKAQLQDKVREVIGKGEEEEEVNVKGGFPPLAVLPEGLEVAANASSDAKPHHGISSVCSKLYSWPLLLALPFPLLVGDGILLLIPISCHHVIFSNFDGIEKNTWPVFNPFLLYPLPLPLTNVRILSPTPVSSFASQVRKKSDKTASAFRRIAATAARSESLLRSRPALPVSRCVDGHQQQTTTGASFPPPSSFLNVGSGDNKEAVDVATCSTDPRETYLQDSIGAPVLGGE